MDKLREICQKLYKNQMVRYVFFGGLTTLVNFVCFNLFVYVFKWELNISNAIAIILSILFAYVVNAKCVFDSQAKGIKSRCMEMLKFFGARGVTFVLEMIAVPALVYFGSAEWLAKIIANVIVLILNFVFSKLLVFTKPKNDKK